eukprot:13997224-Ditylum_brightwellii.AAC.1
MKAWIKANQHYIHSCIKLRKTQDKTKLKDVRSYYHINRKKNLPRKQNDTKRRKHNTKRHTTTSPSIVKVIRPSSRKNRTTTPHGPNNPIHSRSQAWKTSRSQQEAMTSVTPYYTAQGRPPDKIQIQGSILDFYQANPLFDPRTGATRR